MNPLEIRLLTESDLPRAMALKEAAGWNQTLEDWRRLLRHDRGGCLAAAVDGQVVATTTTTVYGSNLAWIGMVLVDPAYRRRGLATRLVEHALALLDAARVRTIKLDATPEGQLVYERLGFEAERTIERWAGAATGHGNAGTGRKMSVPPLDRHAFGADRGRMLASIIEDSALAAAVTTGPRGVNGYALARPGSEADYVGPVVAGDLAGATSLLDTLLARLASRRLFVDVNPAFAGARELLAARGFSRQRELIRMRRGEPSPAGTSPMVFAIAGPEVG